MYIIRLTDDPSKLKVFLMFDVKYKTTTWELSYTLCAMLSRIITWRMLTPPHRSSVCAESCKFNVFNVCHVRGIAIKMYISMYQPIHIHLSGLALSLPYNLIQFLYETGWFWLEIQGAFAYYTFPSHNHRNGYSRCEISFLYTAHKLPLGCWKIHVIWIHMPTWCEAKNFIQALKWLIHA